MISMKAQRNDPDDLRTSSFLVYGQPVPQSGMRAVGTAAGPRLITTGGRDLETWRQQVAAEAAVARVRGRRHVGPVCLACHFQFPMPSNRTAAQRRQDSIPKVTQPDLDKLIRAVSDSLTQGGLLDDDAQITEIHASKSEWGDSWTGASIEIRDLWMP